MIHSIFMVLGVFLKDLFVDVAIFGAVAASDPLCRAGVLHRTIVVPVSLDKQCFYASLGPAT